MEYTLKYYSCVVLLSACMLYRSTAFRCAVWDLRVYWNVCIEFGNDRQKFVSFVSRFCTKATQLISKYQRTIISFSINHDLNKNVNVSLRRMKCMSVNVFIWVFRKAWLVLDSYSNFFLIPNQSGILIPN